MRWRSSAVGMLAATAVLLGAPFAHAGGADGIGGAKTLTLALKGSVDTVPVHGYRSYSRSSFYQPYAYSFYRPYAQSFYRPYAYSFYRPYAQSFYQPNYAPYYAPRDYSFNFGYGLYRPYYFAPQVYYYSSPVPYFDYWPISGGISVTSSLLGASVEVFRVRPFSDAPTVPQPQPAEQTYPYNGDPRDPVPMPRATPEPTSVPPRPGPVDSRVVSTAPKRTPFVYPAYGEALERAPVVLDPPLPKATREVRLPR